MDLRSSNPGRASPSACARPGAPAYRAGHFRWLHGQTVETVEQMANVPARARDALADDPPLRPLVTDVIQNAPTARASCASARTTAEPSSRS